MKMYLARDYVVPSLLRYVASLALLVGLCFTLSTCTWEKVCPPEEEDAAIHLRALVRSFGNRYKVTGYTINGVDRTSYLDTLHLRNKVIDFREFDEPYERRNRKPTDPASECYMVLNYTGKQNFDTLSFVNDQNYSILRTGFVCYKVPSGDFFLSCAFVNEFYVNGSLSQFKTILPQVNLSNRYSIGGYRALPSQAGNNVFLTATIENDTYVLTLTPR